MAITCGWTLPGRRSSTTIPSPRQHPWSSTSLPLPAALPKHKMTERKWRPGRVNTPKLLDRTAYLMPARQRENKKSCNSNAWVLTGLWWTSEHEQCHRATADCCYWSDQEISQLRTSICLVLSVPVACLLPSKIFQPQSIQKATRFSIGFLCLPSCMQAMVPLEHLHIFETT